MPQNHGVVELRERAFRLFPRSDLFDDRGHSLLLPETRALSAVELADDVAGVKVRALGLVGYLPLTERITLNITPKFPSDSLWYMLEVAENYDTIALPVLRRYEKHTERAPHQLLLKAFCHFLGPIVSAGLWRGYRREQNEGYYKPKPHFGRTLSRYLSKGDELRTSSEVWAFSSDLLPNRFLKSACKAFIRIVPRNSDWEAERRLLLDALASLDRIASAPYRPEDMNSVDNVPLRLRADYRGALSIYSVLLGYTHVGFQYEAGGSMMPSFLFSLDDVFEAFVRNICREGLWANGIRVVDGNIHRNQRRLFTDTSRYPTKPDLICSRGNHVVAIGEAKYKPRIHETDRYQVISHVTACGAPVGVWISPANNVSEAGLNYVGQLPTSAKFYHYRIYLGADIRGQARHMVEALAQLLAPVEIGAN